MLEKGLPSQLRQLVLTWKRGDCIHQPVGLDTAAGDGLMSAVGMVKQVVFGCRFTDTRLQNSNSKWLDRLL